MASPASFDPLTDLPRPFPRWGTLCQLSFVGVVLVIVAAMGWMWTVLFAIDFLERLSRDLSFSVGQSWQDISTALVFFWPVLLLTGFARTQLIVFGRDSWDLDTPLPDQLVVAFYSTLRAIPVLILTAMAWRVGNFLATKIQLPETHGISDAHDGFYFVDLEQLRHGLNSFPHFFVTILPQALSVSVLLSVGAWLYWPWQAFDVLEIDQRAANAEEDPPADAKSPWTLSPLAWALAAGLLVGWIVLLQEHRNWALILVGPLLVGALRAHWRLLLRERWDEPTTPTDLITALATSTLLACCVLAIMWGACELASMFLFPSISRLLLQFRIQVLELPKLISALMGSAALSSTLFFALFAGLWTAWVTLWMPLARLNQGLGIDHSPAETGIHFDLPANETEPSDDADVSP